MGDSFSYRFDFSEDSCYTPEVYHTIHNASTTESMILEVNLTLEDSKGGGSFEISPAILMIDTSLLSLHMQSGNIDDEGRYSFSHLYVLFMQ